MSGMNDMREREEEVINVFGDMNTTQHTTTINNDELRNKVRECRNYLADNGRGMRRRFRRESGDYDELVQNMANRILGGMDVGNDGLLIDGYGNEMLALMSMVINPNARDFFERLINDGEMEDVPTPLNNDDMNRLTKCTYGEMKRGQTDNNKNKDNIDNKSDNDSDDDSNNNSNDDSDVDSDDDSDDDNDSDGDGDSDECAICKTDFEGEDRITILPCEGRHFFHDECIDKWLAKLSKKCPLCRTNIEDVLKN